MTSKAWSVKGIERDIREKAKAAADAEGMTVGSWIESVILQPDRSEEGLEPPQFLSPDASVAASASIYKERELPAVPPQGEGILLTLIWLSTALTLMWIVVFVMLAYDLSWTDILSSTV